MLVLLALVVSVAAVDSINPSTLGPVLLLALGGHPKREVAAFTLGVFAVSTAGGLVLIFGPGRALLAVVSKPTPHTVHLIEIATGTLLLAAAAVLWLTRSRIERRLRHRPAVAGRSAFLIGAGIMVVELPTAFPYLGALAAILEAHRGIAVELLLVLAYNVLFVAPMLLVLAAVAAQGERGTRLVRSARDGLEHYGAVIIPIALALLGAAILVIGGVGLASD